MYTLSAYGSLAGSLWLTGRSRTLPSVAGQGCLIGLKCPRLKLSAGRLVLSGTAPPGGPQRRSGEPSTGWFASTVCSPFPEERFAFLFYGASPAPRDFLKKIE